MTISLHGFLSSKEAQGDSFGEVESILLPHEVAAEAERCLFCHDAPCNRGCPADVDVAGFIRRLRTGNFLGAGLLIHRANIFGGTCGRVCPAEVLCEGACVLGAAGRPITIRRLQRFACDHSLPRLSLVLAPVSTSTGKGAVVGAGPAGVAGAAELRRLGWEINVYERGPAPGGLARFSIPPYRLPGEVVRTEIEAVKAAGVTFHFSTAVGRDLTVYDLLSTHDAVLITTGLGDPRPLAVPGADLNGVWQALDLLRKAAARSGAASGAVVGEGPPRFSGTVAVVGGGNTAVDAACTAKRLGADRVIVIYRRGREDMPAWESEYRFAVEEGIEFLWYRQPVRIIGESGKAEVLELLETRPGEPGPDGRPVPRVIPGSEQRLAVNHVVAALGQFNLRDLGCSAALETHSSGRPVVEKATGATSNPRIYVAGDVATGGATVVEAVGQAKAAAKAMHAAMATGRLDREGERRDG